MTAEELVTQVQAAIDKEQISPNAEVEVYDPKDPFEHTTTIKQLELGFNVWNLLTFSGERK